MSSSPRYICQFYISSPMTEDGCVALANTTNEHNYQKSLLNGIYIGSLIIIKKITKNKKKPYNILYNIMTTWNKIITTKFEVKDPFYL